MIEKSPIVIKGCTCPGGKELKEECETCQFRQERIDMAQERGRYTIDLAREFVCFSCKKKKPIREAKGAVDKTTGEGECLDCWNFSQR